MIIYSYHLWYTVNRRQTIRYSRLDMYMIDLYSQQHRRAVSKLLNHYGIVELRQRLSPLIFHDLGIPMCHHVPPIKRMNTFQGTANWIHDNLLCSDHKPWHPHQRQISRALYVSVAIHRITLFMNIFTSTPSNWTPKQPKSPKLQIAYSTDICTAVARHQQRCLYIHISFIVYSGRLPTHPLSSCWLTAWYVCVYIYIYIHMC